MSEIGKIQVLYSAKGNKKYEVAVTHPLLHKHQVIKSDSLDVIRRKAQLKAQEWDEIWKKKREQEIQTQIKQTQAAQKQEQKNAESEKKEQKKREAEIKTHEAQNALDSLNHILEFTLGINDAIDWNDLLEPETFPEPMPSEPSYPVDPGQLILEEKPKRSDPQYSVTPTFVDKVFKSRLTEKQEEADRKFLRDHANWEKRAREQYERYQELVKAYENSVRLLNERHQKDLDCWHEARSLHLAKCQKSNKAILEKKQKYENCDPDAIYDYCEMVLSRSQYPDFISRNYELQYNPGNKILIVDYEMPIPSSIPTLKEIRYIPSRDEFAEKHINSSQVDEIYDLLLYQITLRTIHELFEADLINAIDAIVFNGIVADIDPATGNLASRCVLSIQVNKPEFLTINLAAIDPKACFRKLKGVGSSKLHSLTAVAPILQLDREDRRFVESYNVADELNSGTNLAAMDWEDFEHLIREVFEKEFAANGGEVKVTRASRDGGVDAVVFDPDPIRGGKIVIQAKRYTNTVGVSAVRDLYGTLVNEGANKGILVSTADFGPDAYDFAKGKPITLLNGSNLLHLLEKHGHKACIDLQEAKKILSQATTA